MENLGEIGALLSSAAYFTHLSISGITLAFPKRPSWIAFGGALGLGVLFTALLAVASGAILSHPFTSQIVAQIILVGVAAGGGAAGTAVTQSSAEAKRQHAIGPEPKPEPDPLTPKAQPAGAIAIEH
jgi:hypothetical protein